MGLQDYNKIELLYVKRDLLHVKRNLLNCVPGAGKGTDAGISEVTGTAMGIGVLECAWACVRIYMYT